MPDNQFIISDVNELKKQINELQSACVEIKVNTTNNLNTLRDIDSRLRTAEQNIALINSEIEHIKSDFNKEMDYQEEYDSKNDSALTQYQEQIHEVQGEVNQLRMSLDRLKEKEETIEKNKEAARSVLHPVYSWIIMVIITLLFGAVVYTITMNKDSSNNNAKTIIEESLKSK